MKKGNKRLSSTVGHMHPSQVLYTFGVGAIIDLPHISGMVMGTNEWLMEDGAQEIHEPRLLRVIQQFLGPQLRQLKMPAPAEDWEQRLNFKEPTKGIRLVPFPTSLVCIACRRLTRFDSSLVELKPDLYHPDRTKYVHINCDKAKNPPAVPARYLIICEDGHIDDFPWNSYLHHGGECPESSCRQDFYLEETGISGAAADVELTCKQCDKSRKMEKAFQQNRGEPFSFECHGHHPHLRERKNCQGSARAIMLGASNIWFPHVVSGLSLPEDQANPLENWCGKYWENLEKALGAHYINAWQQMSGVELPEGATSEVIWETVQTMKNQAEEASDENSLNVKLPEWEAFTESGPVLETENFTFSALKKTPNKYNEYFSQILRVDRLKEVRALTGFYRLSAPDVEDLQEDRQEAVHLSKKKPTWIPASEVHGEGLFFQFKESAITEWLNRLDQEYLFRFERMHQEWRRIRGLDEEKEFPGGRYLLLHTFAHALIRQLSLACGYTASSLRERIYSTDDSDGKPMAGVLIYTAAPGSEGTLGGLVEQAKSSENIEYHLDQALNDLALCSTDPHCAEHLPESQRLHGAACYACCFLSETSCESSNRYLDRSVLVPSLDRGDLSFFTHISGKSETINKDPGNSAIKQYQSQKIEFPVDHSE